MIRLQRHFQINFFVPECNCVDDMTAKDEEFLIQLLKQEPVRNNTDWLQEVLKQHDFLKLRFGNPYTITLLASCVIDRSTSIDELYKRQIELEYIDRNNSVDAKKYEENTTVNQIINARIGLWEEDALPPQMLIFLSLLPSGVRKDLLSKIWEQLGYD